MKRRDFLGRAALGLGAVATGACRPEDGAGAGIDAERTADTAAVDTADTAWDTEVTEPVCDMVTPPAGEGPYHREDAPVRSDLRTAGESGTDLYIKFIVRSTDSCERIADAVIDFWHCQQDGTYDMDSSDMHYRAKVRAGFEGGHDLVTIKPVSYYTDDGKLMPAHFHLIVTAEGFSTLTTQIRFANDPDDDGGVPERLLVEVEEHSDGSESFTYTLWLDPLS